MKIYISIAATLCLGFLFLPIGLPGKGQCSTDIPKAEASLSKAFSPLDSRLHLFAIEGEFVLQAGYAEDDGLSEVRVVPKSFFHGSHPEWTEPDSPLVLSLGTYEELLSRIRTIKPLGNLITRGEIGIMLNLRTSYLDQYENGIVERSMFRDFPEKPYDVASFRVAYFRKIAGKLEKMEGPGAQVGEQVYRIKVNDKWYWTTAKQFKSLKKGQEVSVQAAGPISVNF
jgi:hypothetical protein